MRGEDAPHFYYIASGDNEQLTGIIPFANSICQSCLDASVVCRF